MVIKYKFLKLAWVKKKKRKTERAGYIFHDLTERDEARSKKCFDREMPRECSAILLLRFYKNRCDFRLHRSVDRIR